MVKQQCPLDEIKIVKITAIHAIQAGDLTLHHKDPFDRMIIAQASIENLTVITSDSIFGEYDVAVLF